jgi:hypothetical protein
LLATSYPLLEVFWTMLIFFAFVIWIWLLFIVFADLFRRRDVSGWAKVAWIIFVVVLPYLGVFVYLIAQHRGMTERAIEQQEAARSRMDQDVRSAAEPTATEQIAKGEELLKRGAVSQAEFDQIKQRALASVQLGVRPRAPPAALMPARARWVLRLLVRFSRDARPRT